MKSTQRKEILEFARNLYLEVDAEGKKANTWDSISKNILKKYKLEIHLTTIQKWSKKHDWEGLFEKIKMAGIEKSKQNLQDKENVIVDEKSQTIADIYKSNKQLLALSQKTIISRLTGRQLKDGEGNNIDADISTTDLVRILQHSESSLLELLDKKKGGNEKLPDSVKIVFE